MSDEKQIYVDLDDVLSETGRAFVAVLERDFGRTVDFEDMESFDLGASFNLSHKELAAFFVAAHRDEVLSGLDPMAGAVDVLNDWAMAGYEISIVTGRPPSTEAASRRWLDRHQVPHHSLTFVDKYSRDIHPGAGVEEKTAPVSLETLAQRQFSFAVEDSMDMARFMAGTVGVEVSLIDRPWNRKSARVEGVSRCVNWQEVRALFP
ncbi:MAG: bifunctional metallophosphatase/5'-nucleotidase [Acidobacteriota bacterium]|nr:bifunctional metallophosphatase/5'-nucleotidase [Acidobacteriota bacterium]